MSHDTDGGRIYAVSDIHVDFPENMRWVFSISRDRHLEDVLILAGDVSDNLGQLERSLAGLRERFSRVLFVPGNHDLWIRDEEAADSWEKFLRLETLCRSLDVGTEPERIFTASPPGAVWIVPLFSWYVQPEEGPGSLFVRKPGEDPTLSMWADNYFVRWPERKGLRPPAHYFLELNERQIDGGLERGAADRVISFSHFLPRRDLIFATPSERAGSPAVRKDYCPDFNFSRVAGCEQLDVQLRSLGSSVHVYGHQHRNRRRTIDGVLYVSNCLGYPRDRAERVRADPHAALSLIG